MRKFKIFPAALALSAAVLAGSTPKAAVLPWSWMPTAPRTI